MPTIAPRIPDAPKLRRHTHKTKSLTPLVTHIQTEKWSTAKTTTPQADIYRGTGARCHLFIKQTQSSHSPPVISYRSQTRYFSIDFFLLAFCYFFFCIPLFQSSPQHPQVNVLLHSQRKRKIKRKIQLFIGEYLSAKLNMMTSQPDKRTLILPLSHPVEQMKNRDILTKWSREVELLACIDMEIQRRPLTEREADQIVKDIRSCPEITGYSKEEWMGAKDTFALVDLNSENLLGAVLVHHLAFKWSEVAVVFVLPKYRGCGLGRYMLPTVLRTLAHYKRRILIFFSDERMRSVVRDSGFQTYDTPEEFSAANFWQGVFLRYLYKPQWLANHYRRRELKRKKKCFNANYAFRIGLYRGWQHS